jgi:hypothetical protein
MLVTGGALTLSGPADGGAPVPGVPAMMSGAAQNGFLGALGAVASAQQGQGGMLPVQAPVAAGQGAGAGAGGGQAAAQNAAAAAQKAEINNAINKIKASKYATTDEGKAVLAQLLAAQKAGMIKFGPASMTDAAKTLADGTIVLNPLFMGDNEAVASELVHEGAHLVYRARYPKDAKDSLGINDTINNEYYALSQQIIYYKMDQKGKFLDPKSAARMDARLTKYEDGELTGYIIQRGGQTEWATSWRAFWEQVAIKNAEYQAFQDKMARMGFPVNSFP